MSIPWREDQSLEQIVIPIVPLPIVALHQHVINLPYISCDWPDKFSVKPVDRDDGLSKMDERK